MRILEADFVGSQVAELARQVPTYHDFIPVENGRDLVMIKRKLETDQYNSIDALEADFDLMIGNCYAFNGMESQVSYSARELSDKFKLGLKRIRTGSSRVTCVLLLDDTGPDLLTRA